MIENLPMRFWAEVTVAACTSGLFLVSLVWRDWIEALFGVDPDHHNGSIEWLIVAATLVTAAFFFTAARRDWRRAVVSS